MPELTFLVAGRLDTRSGGSIYNRRMAESLVRLGWRVDVRELDGSFPFPTAAAVEHAHSQLSLLPTGTLVLVDGLAYGAMDHVIAAVAQRLCLVALVHLPLAAEVGLDDSSAGQLKRSERAALSHARRVIVTGPATFKLMQDLGLSHPDIISVPPGTDAAPLAVGSSSPDVHLLTVGPLTAGKGHEILIEALAALPHRRWRLTCAGSTSRSPGTVDRVCAAIARHRLGECVSLAGELDERGLALLYDRSDVMVSASLRETFGMAVAEALARGLPVVATATGSALTLVGNDAGTLVPPGDRAALTLALARMIDDQPFRDCRAAGARRARVQLTGWDEAAASLARALTF
jgi:glycosyltransferase involved in cell wall biosynthesis